MGAARLCKQRGGGGGGGGAGCYGNFGPPKILDPGTKFSGKFSPPGPNFPENFDPGLKILVLAFACACVCSTCVQSRCCMHSASC